MLEKSQISNVAIECVQLKVMADENKVRKTRKKISLLIFVSSWASLMKMFLFSSQWLSRDLKGNLPFSPTGIVLPFLPTASFWKHRIDYESSAQSWKMIWNVNSYNGQFKISKSKPCDKFVSWES